MFKIIDIRARNNFTLLRLFFATLVVLGHFTTLPHNPQTYLIYGYADSAVQGFFIVSGYLIAGSWEKNPKAFDFFVKRFFRIYPLYITVIVIQTIVMIALLPPGGFVLKDVVRYFTVNAAFLNFLQYDIGGLFTHDSVEGINPSLWTLKIEVAFYAILPAVWLLYRRFGWAVLAAIFVASTLCYELAMQANHLSLSKQLPCQMRYFAVGVGLYAWRDRIQVRPGLAALLIVLLVIFYSWLALPLQDLFAPLLMGGIVFLTATRLPSIRLKRDISFGVYLFHAPIIQTSILLGYFRNETWFVVGLVCVVYLLAMGAEWAIELPGIALGRRLLKRLDPAAVDPLVR